MLWEKGKSIGALSGEAGCAAAVETKKAAIHQRMS